MADISAEIAAFKSAVYGEDVRTAMVNLANKVNNESSAAAAATDEVSELESALLVTQINLIGATERVFNVTSSSSHTSTEGFWPVQIASGTKFSVIITSTAITGYQLYAYYSDGTNARIYSGSSMNNSYTAAKDISSLGFYIGSSFITTSGAVDARLTLTDGFYNTTSSANNTIDMMHGQIGKKTQTWSITSGTAISGQTHEVGVHIDEGESFSIEIQTAPYGSLTAVQYWLIYDDNTEERIYSSSYYFTYIGIAKKNVKAVRLSVGATGVISSGTCTIVIKHLDDTMVFREIAELNKNAAIKSINHRGYYTAPENTIPAFLLSYKAGFKYVETDVQLTSDGVPVLLHDGTINRTARNQDGTEISVTINIKDISYNNVINYDFGVYKGSEFANTKIPTLQEFVLLCKRLSLHPYIEIKASGLTELQVQGIVDVVISCGMKDNVTWISQNSIYLGYVSSYCQKCRLGLVVSEITSGIITTASNLKSSYNDVFIDSSSVTNNEITLCLNANLPLEYWSANAETTVASMNPYISGITSDVINVVQYYTDRVFATGTAKWS